jgi:hypothetical protein
MIRISVSASEKIGTNNYGSIGAQCGLEIELDSRLADEAAALHEAITRYQQIATTAMRAHLGRMTATNGNANGKANGTPAPSQPPRPSSTGTGNGQPTNGAAKPPTTSTATTAPPAPANPPRPNSARTTPTTKVPAAPTPAPNNAQAPANQRPNTRDTLNQELARQFAPPETEPEEVDPLCEEDDGPEDDTPHSGLELLGWARHQPGDAKHELAAIGAKRGFPRLIKDWSPTMVSQALQTYLRTSAT